MVNIPLHGPIFSIDDVILQLTYDQRQDLTALYDVTSGHNFPATLAVDHEPVA